MVEHQGRGQPQPGRLGQRVAQLDGGQRVQAQFLERALRGHRGAVRVAEHGGHPVPHQGHHQVGAGLLGQGEQAPHEAAVLARAGDAAPAPRADQCAQQGRQVPAARRQGGEVEPGGHGQGVPDRRVEQGQALVGAQRQHPGAVDLLQVAVGQRPGHALPRLPQAPGQRGRGQAEGAAVRGEGVEEGVARRVIALARRAEHRRGRGEQHEVLHLAHQLVQVPGRVHLGPQHAVDRVRGERGDQGVVEHARGVHDAGQRVLGADGGDHGRQRGAVGDVAGHHPRGRTPFRQPGDEVGGTGRVGAAAAEQQQVPDAVLDHEVFGQGAAEVAGAPGDQDRPVGVPGRGGRGLGPDQPGGERLPVAHHDLVLAGDDGVAVALDVHEPEAAGVLGLGGADQAPGGGRRRVGAAEGAAGDEHQRGVGLPHPRQGLGHQPVRRGDHVGAAHQRHDLRVGGVHGRGGGRPLDPEQRIGAGGAELFGGHGAQVQRADGGDGLTGAVGDGQFHPRLDRPAQADPRGGGPGGVQRHAVPDERQQLHALFDPGQERDGVQGGVQERGVQAEGGRVAHLLGQRDLGVHVVAEPPGRGQALEHRAVAAHVVEAVQVERGRPGGRPGRGGQRVDLGDRRGEHAGGVAHPGRLGGSRVAGVHPDVRAASLVRRGDPDLHRHRAVVGQQQRRRDGQFVEVPETGLVARAQGQLHEPGAGEQDPAQGGVVGQPGLRPRRQPAGEHQAVPLGQVDGGAEQRVLDADQARTGHVAGRRRGLRPVVVPLEGVGGQVHAPALGQQ
ncbi:hypothetical protein UO65_2663 [Actinokineospora spheciospongiae]|uniref:Uncharacterized protein n=1 Tax=Actinokineospora spheciospongiae TaxID=909613 RepID=W7IYR5_9PSEU|nr:hypothetical protein UO65_2663 [Actinokineospora spheciospongiae]